MRWSNKSEGQLLQLAKGGHSAGRNPYSRSPLSASHQTHATPSSHDKLTPKSSASHAAIPVSPDSNLSRRTADLAPLLSHLAASGHLLGFLCTLDKCVQAGVLPPAPCHLHRRRLSISRARRRPRKAPPLSLGDPDRCSSQLLSLHDASPCLSALAPRQAERSRREKDN